ncbi:hypothetical protein F3Y22_tig00110457pilonHSYRG00142 [Hibiscus syriacus]|uniref:O-methyltransferase C-terminal domain-containing protein n=1 Tax=Hibiscus syriacus TaxID=106335 RepID=A0A6A3ANI5_HIBSY|nr:hypothetical protein F3Y22_tig00110457pilonHSYRG00142 [Hibiscus syriacus]
MRILVRSGFFSESGTDDRQKAYALTPVSRLLRKDNPMSSRPFILAMLDPVFMKPWEYLSGWLQTDKQPSEFIAAHGETLWDYAGHKPRLNRFFNDAMASDGLVAARAVLGGENVKYLGGNMLEEVPHGDIIMVKRCKEAIEKKEKGGKVIIIEMIMRNEDLDETKLFFDMEMMVCPDGKERDEQQWKKLCCDAGFTRNMYHILVPSAVTFNPFC